MRALLLGEPAAVALAGRCAALLEARHRDVQHHACRALVALHACITAPQARRRTLVVLGGRSLTHCSQTRKTLNQTLLRWAPRAVLGPAALLRPPPPPPLVLSRPVAGVVVLAAEAGTDRRSLLREASRLLHTITADAAAFDKVCVRRAREPAGRRGHPSSPQEWLAELGPAALGHATRVLRQEMTSVARSVRLPWCSERGMTCGHERRMQQQRLQRTTALVDYVQGLTRAGHGDMAVRRACLLRREHRARADCQLRRGR